MLILLAWVNKIGCFVLLIFLSLFKMLCQLLVTVYKGSATHPLPFWPVSNLHSALYSLGAPLNQPWPSRQLKLNHKSSCLEWQGASPCYPGATDQGVKECRHAEQAWLTLNVAFQEYAGISRRSEWARSKRGKL